MTWLVCGCGYTCGLGVGVGGLGNFGQIWASVGNDGQALMGQTDQAGMGDMASGWVWVCVQV